jgi:hypothetical protein
MQAFLKTVERATDQQPSGLSISTMPLPPAAPKGNQVQFDPALGNVHRKRTCHWQFYFHSSTGLSTPAWHAIALMDAVNACLIH